MATRGSVELLRHPNHAYKFRLMKLASLEQTPAVTSMIHLWVKRGN
jgi:hypothetical protein